jgi:hypothetical protein
MNLFVADFYDGVPALQLIATGYHSRDHFEKLVQEQNHLSLSLFKKLRQQQVCLHCSLLLQKVNRISISYPLDNNSCKNKTTYHCRFSRNCGSSKFEELEEEEEDVNDSVDQSLLD